MNAKKDTDLDALTAIELGRALYRVLARQNEESEMDELEWDDTGVLMNGAFVEMGHELKDTILEMLYGEEI